MTSAVFVAAFLGAAIPLVVFCGAAYLLFMREARREITESKARTKAVKAATERMTAHRDLLRAVMEDAQKDKEKKHGPVC
jgi:hypothetical protein